MSDSYYLGPPVDDYKDLYESLLPGANVLVFCDTSNFARVTCDLEDQGFEIRDCITVLTPGEPMFIPTVMKPLDGTFVNNALEHGVAGYNIDAGRVRVDEEDPNRRPNRTEASEFDDDDRVALNGALVLNTFQDEGAHNSKGRYPTNLILMHHPECECQGTKRVKPSNGSGRAHERMGEVENDVYGTGWMQDGKIVTHLRGDGTEEVEDWECVEGCPVKTLDDQTSDKVHGAGHAREGLDADLKPEDWDAVTFAGGWKANKTVHRFGDVGGASRFFKHVVDNDDLVRYLESLIQPPPAKGYV